ncbi:amidohydrolase family protein [Alteromonas sp. a30]|uniref:amidohydrolase family protein n=1 Tax=Alteromonas sp. a30 TaxID=2730917 RepID=UPI002281FF89|nr:amidohydrolase family protein [Alteromonas sp. a30]MCY7295197.1 amidohydrolase family protein [Alteromonas sp. a30]
MSGLNKIAAVVAGTFLSAAAMAENIAITGALVHTFDKQGSIENATVLIRDGKIESIMADGEAPKGYNSIDARGKIVTPGLIVAKSGLGLEEVSFSAGINDANFELKDAKELGASVDSQFGINMNSSLINVARIEGVTTVATGANYSNTLFQGQGSVISLGDINSPLLKTNAFMSINLSGAFVDSEGGSRAVVWPKLIRVLKEAASLNGKTLGINQEWNGEFAKTDVNALIPVVKGDMPLFVSADRVADIRQVIALKQRFDDLDLVLVHATEGWLVAEEIAEAGIPVVVNPESNLPFDFDELGATLKNAGRLSRAGVKVSIANVGKYSADSHNTRLVTQLAGNAVANGMPWADAMAALTVNPAELLDVEDTLGSLAKGKQADVVIWSGDPLEVMTYAEVVIINGEPITMESRQTKLRDRYMTLGQDMPYRYNRP